MTNAPGNTNQLVGRSALDPSGDKIGTISDVYIDNDTNEPEWLAISTGLFGNKVSFAPLEGAELVEDDVYLPYDKALVKDAPNADVAGQLTTNEEDALYAHYGRSTVETGGVEAVGPRRDTDRRETDDDAMTRSEEELDVQTRTRETGRARLRKWVETEEVEIRVPVRREKARMVTEPITDANRAAALAGEDISEAEHEVVLHEEVIDVDKRVVPKERVRLETDVEADEVTVDESVRKERIAMDHDTDRPGA
jgi:stress response protein YsnF/sporulation protein YlmC with PRC-barrel domain